MFVVDGNWSGWSEWEECSITCGGGLMARNRTCSNPEPQYGGKYCTGNDTNISDCADNPCPSMYCASKHVNELD